MGKKLVIAEKPSLGRSIASALSWWKNEKFERKGKGKTTWMEGNEYVIALSVGHIYELIDLDAYFDDYDPEKKHPWTMDRLPFFPENWDFRFEGKPQFSGLIRMLNYLMNRNDIDAIYNAGDPDREGQRLIDEIIEHGLKSQKAIYRLWLPDTTNKTIQQAFMTAKPNTEYVDFSASAETRAEMDWLLGIELTRYASIKAQSFVRIGRCVCPIVQHIIEREKTIKEFVPKPYSVVTSKEKTNGEIIELTSKRTFDEGHEVEAQALADAFNKAGATVTNIKTERKTVNSGKLFSMSDLQGFACDVDKSLTPATVLAATQTLYEGGYVTYPRTNSSYLATNEVVKVNTAINGLAQAGITGLINKQGTKSIYDDSKIEAHSAIIPTGKWPGELSGTEKTVYECILNRFCAVFCEDACTVDRTTIVIHCYDEDFTLKGDVQVTLGWRKFEKPSSGDKILPKLHEGESVNIKFAPVGKMTTPPKRYTVKALNNWMVAPLRGVENEGTEYTDEDWKEILSDATICTDATRADTISRCIQSQYISLKKGVYYGEPAGFYLVDAMNSLGITLDVKTTVELSKDLYHVKAGTVSRIDVLNKTKDTINQIMNSGGTIKSQYQGTAGQYTVIGKCPKCGGDVVETKRAFACLKKCGVALWKDNKFLEAIGKTLTKQVATSLIKNGKVHLTDCVGKSGKSFDCNVLCDFSGERPSFSLDFTREVLGKCPVCGSDMVETPKAYSCTNKDCHVALFKKTKYYGQELTVTQAKAKKLLNKETASFTVQKKNGEKGSASLIIEVTEYNGKKYLKLTR